MKLPKREWISITAKGTVGESTEVMLVPGGMIVRTITWTEVGEAVAMCLVPCTPDEAWEFLAQDGG